MKKIIILCIISLFVFSSFSVAFGYNNKTTALEKSHPSESILSGLMNSPWPMYGHDARHTFQSQYNTSDNPGIEKWRLKISGGSGSPVIDNNNNIYLGGGSVKSVSSNGTLIWSRDVWGGVFGTIAIDENGILYASTGSSYPSYFYALDLNGTIIWKFQQGWESSSSPTIDENGTINFGDESETLYALNPNGSLKWEYGTERDVSSSPIK